MYKRQPIRSLSLDKGGYGHQRVEPASRLVYAFADKICREQLLVKDFFIFKRVMPLGKRHGSGVEPTVHYLRYPGHRLTADKVPTGKLIQRGIYDTARLVTHTAPFGDLEAMHQVFRHSIDKTDGYLKGVFLFD